MAFAADQTVGNFRITSQLGVGGMGEVWRAEDTKLGREVALKVLPAEFASDPERYARFEREAKVLASLNHPNIAHLYGLETVEAESGTGTGTGTDGEATPQNRGTSGPQIHFLVMELVEGEDLSERIARGAVPVDEAVGIATQIAEALEAAHEQGIVHRDLKPANIKLRPDGTVKVLDFGLAKAWDADNADHSLSMSPTMTAHATAAGVILGTAAYMSPEQAAGTAADRRADIWAFGVVFWEMLTGHKLFEGETVSHVLASVLKDEPALEALPDETPPRIRELIERSLRKNPKRRLQAIGDARVLLEDYAADPGSFDAATVAAPEELAPPPSTLKRLLIPLAAAVAALVFGLIGGSALLEGTEEAGTIRFHVQAPEGRGFQLDSTRPGPVVISPDGASLAFSAWDTDGSVRLFIRELDEVVARPLSGTEGAQYPFWSPDSKSLGFFADEKLKKVNASGGQPLTLCDASDGKGGSWGSNGIILFAPGPRDPIHSVPQLGGEPEPVTTFDEDRGDDSHRHPRWLPDGKHFIYLARFPDGADEGQAVVGSSIDGGAPTVVTRSPAAAEFANGHLLYMRESTLMAQPFDPKKLELHGDPVPVADSVALISTGTAQGVFSASANGVLAFQSGTLSWGQVLRWKDRDGEILATVGEPARFWDTVEMSPDGTTAAVRIDDGDNVDIWIVELDRNLRTRFTFSPVMDQGPTFSADGATLYWENNIDQKSHIFRKAIGGSGEGELIATYEKTTWPLSWHPDGTTLMTTVAVEESPQNIDIFSIAETDWNTPRPWQSSEFIDYGAEFSPDGRWVVYGSNESGAWEIYVAPFPGPGRKWQVSTDGGGWPRWRGDGREIFYENDSGTLMGVTVEDRGDALAFGEPEELFQHKVSRSKSWDVSDDGERFLLVEPEQSQDPQPITVVVNWPRTIEDQR